MAIRLIQLGSPRQRGEGLRIGTVRRPPRGVRKSQYAKQDWFDVWLPNLAPSASLMRTTSIRDDGTGWSTFARRYQAELKQPAQSHLLDVLAALSHSTSFSVGLLLRRRATLPQVDPSACFERVWGDCEIDRYEAHSPKPTGVRVITIRPEGPENAARIRRINELAFGQPAEADLVEKLRQACSSSLSLVAEDDAVVGHILFTPVVVESAERSVLGMGMAPMAVLPDRQRQGIGSQLVRRGLESSVSGAVRSLS